MPPTYTRLLLLLLLPHLQIFIFLCSKTSSQGALLFINCSGHQYNSSSPYDTNLSRLLGTLASSAPNASNLFSTSVAGQAFGLAQCGPGTAAASCTACLNSAAAKATASPVTGGCGGYTSVDVRYDLCVLRYSNERFFTVPDLQVSSRSNTETATRPEEFSRRNQGMLQKLSSDAAAAETRFAVQTATSSGLQDAYGMAWCTLDLSGSDCLRCLDVAIPALAMDRIGAQAESASCFIAFETHLFFSQSFIVPSPAPSPQVSDNLGGAGGVNATGAAGAGRSEAEEEFSSAGSMRLDLGAIRRATNYFSDSNKLGEGGFGVVYKGVLRDGQEVAVKRLSNSSWQGLMEMKNEIVSTAKLQHKNLVKLVGCCLEEDEKLLVYEYLPNKSLDKILFGK
ncbi:Cysteine-rich receptor-like protein kinase 10 [Apostasia shenzhenica]|uniref:Cysteine-rich receptor-like protein kinase 10 n=1 Tax=Apostasia shenzhenica TaxID=1088818 RepID=A0A2H9ZSW7_9ASPA|nr:Cysteine-rich receptor-like protein kinase 10 [Apostasia shenzhenica]